MPTSANDITLTKEDIGALIRVWVNNTDDSVSLTHHCHISRKLGRLFGMFFSPDRKFITLRLDEEESDAGTN